MDLRILKKSCSFKSIKMSCKTYIYLLALLLLMACQNEKLEETKAPVKLLAKAGNESLRQDEYLSLFSSSGVIQDSTIYSKKLIEAWAIDALLFEEASLKLREEEVQVEKQVEEYKRALVNHIYQTKLVEANLDTVISEEEIRAYYNTNRDNFVLKDNIVKVDYIKVPTQAADIDKIKRLLKSNLTKDKDALKVLCVQNADNFFLNDSTWLYTSDIRKEIPKLTDEPDFSLYTGKVVQFEDEFYFYYLKIKDLKIKNGLSPIHFERSNIKKYILLNRRTELLNDYKINLLEEAKAKKTFLLY